MTFIYLGTGVGDFGQFTLVLDIDPV